MDAGGRNLRSSPIHILVAHRSDLLGGALRKGLRIQLHDHASGHGQRLDRVCPRDGGGGSGLRPSDRAGGRRHPARRGESDSGRSRLHVHDRHLHVGVVRAGRVVLPGVDPTCLVGALDRRWNGVGGRGVPGSTVRDRRPVGLYLWSGGRCAAAPPLAHFGSGYGDAARLLHSRLPDLRLGSRTDQCRYAPLEQRMEAVPDGRPRGGSTRPRVHHPLGALDLAARGRLGEPRMVADEDAGTRGTGGARRRFRGCVFGAAGSVPREARPDRRSERLALVISASSTGSRGSRRFRRGEQSGARGRTDDSILDRRGLVGPDPRSRSRCRRHARRGTAGNPNRVSSTGARCGRRFQLRTAHVPGCVDRRCAPDHLQPVSQDPGRPLLLTGPGSPRTPGELLARAPVPQGKICRWRADGRVSGLLHLGSTGLRELEPGFLAGDGPTPR